MEQLSVFLVVGYVSIHRHPVVVSDYESVTNSAAASISLAVVAVACRTLAATMAKPMGALFAIVVIDSAALHYSFLEDKSCQLGCATAPYNSAGEILGS